MKPTALIMGDGSPTDFRNAAQEAADHGKIPLVVSMCLQWTGGEQLQSGLFDLLALSDEVWFVSHDQAVPVNCDVFAKVAESFGKKIQTVFINE
jgi:hypothetical protein